MKNEIEWSNISFKNKTTTYSKRVSDVCTIFLVKDETNPTTVYSVFLYDRNKKTNKTMKDNYKGTHENIAIGMCKVLIEENKEENL